MLAPDPAEAKWALRALQSKGSLGTGLVLP